MSWKSFKQIRDGTRILNHGYDQCVAVANRFQERVLGRPFVQIWSAYEWWTRYHDLEALHGTYSRSQTPVAGAVIVWDSTWGNGDGHIGVVLAVHSDGTITTLEQNSTHRWTHRYRRPSRMPGLLGYLIPYNNPATASKPSPTVPRAESTGGTKMLMIHRGGKYAIFGPGFWLEFAGPSAASEFLKQLRGGGSARSLAVSASFWNHCKRAAGH